MTEHPQIFLLSNLRMKMLKRKMDSKWNTTYSKEEIERHNRTVELCIYDLDELKSLLKGLYSEKLCNDCSSVAKTVYCDECSQTHSSGHQCDSDDYRCDEQ